MLFRIESLVGLAIDLLFELVGPAVAGKGLVVAADPLPVSRQGEGEQAGVRDGLPAGVEKVLHALDVGVGQGVAAVAGQLAQGAVSQGRVGIEPQGVQAVSQRLVQAALFLQGIAEEQVRLTAPGLRRMASR